jgi:hypothetical protein
MKKLSIILMSMFALFSGCRGAAQPPQGRLTYCSCAKNGAAGLGKDYCELIADEGAAPKIVVVKNEGCRFMESTRAEFEVDEATVEQLQKLLEENKVYKLNGYNVNEAICGGYSYRIYQEYSSGDSVNAFWYGEKIKEEAYSAYYLIFNFFKPWYDQVPEGADINC